MFIKNRKGENGITLVALVVTIVVIVILSTITLDAVLGDNGLIDQAKETKNRTNDMIGEEESKTNSLMTEYANVMAEDNEISLPEIQPTDGSFSEEEGVNTPNIGANMELVVFDDETDTWVKDETNSGYNYLDTSKAGNEDKSEWANAKVTIGGIDSYFVWIPRFAYKITYYTNENKTKTDLATKQPLAPT